VILEKQLLPEPRLRPAYDQVVWLYVYRDFSRSEADLAAERTCVRLGLSSYPQLLLVHPATLAVLARTGRSVESFLRAVERVSVEPSQSVAAAERRRAADRRASKLRDSRSVKAATKALEDADVLVVHRALEILGKKAPAAVAKRAARLLAIPNDLIRFATCAALAKAPDPAANEALESLVSEPEPSRNPNVLRIRAVEALAASGDAGSVQAIAPHAASGDYRNGLTGRAIDALAGIAERHRDAREAVKAALVPGFPAPGGDGREQRMSVALAKRVHAALEKVTGRKAPFPDRWDAESRKKLVEGWK